MQIDVDLEKSDQFRYRVVKSLLFSYVNKTHRREKMIPFTREIVSATVKEIQTFQRIDFFNFRTHWYFKLLERIVNYYAYHDIRGTPREI